MSVKNSSETSTSAFGWIITGGFVISREQKLSKAGSGPCQDHACDC